MKEIERFTVGGTAAGPSIPGPVFQEALGTTISMNIDAKTLYVPAGRANSSGAYRIKIARKGDTIAAYDDGTFDVVERETK